MEVNIWAVLVCTVLAFALGGVWYSVLFGKQWMQITGFDKMTDVEKAAAGKKAGPMYGIQLVLTLFQVYVLAYFIHHWDTTGGVHFTLLLIASFIMPTLIGAVMWSGKPGRLIRMQLLIQASYQLVSFTIVGYILSIWK